MSWRDDEPYCLSCGAEIAEGDMCSDCEAEILGVGFALDPATWPAEMRERAQAFGEAEAHMSLEDHPNDEDEYWPEVAWQPEGGTW